MSICDGCIHSLVCANRDVGYAETMTNCLDFMPKERTCYLESIPYEPGEYEGMRCSVCKTIDLEMGEGEYCSGCGAKKMILTAHM